jgi:hypothetical protein
VIEGHSKSRGIVQVDFSGRPNKRIASGLVEKRLGKRFIRHLARRDKYAPIFNTRLQHRSKSFKVHTIESRCHGFGIGVTGDMKVPVTAFIKQVDYLVELTLCSDIKIFSFLFSGQAKRSRKDFTFLIAIFLIGQPERLNDKEFWKGIGHKRIPASFSLAT